MWDNVPPHTMEKPSTLYATRCAALGAVFLIGVAIAVYPGGTILERGAAGYSFSHNFLSDLGSRSALNGASNSASRLLCAAGIALFTAALLLQQLWILRRCLGMPGQRWAALTACIVGALACAGLIVAMWVPPDRNMALHLRLVGFSLAAGVTACTLFAFGVSRNRSLPRMTAGTYLGAAAVLALLYVMRWGPSIAAAGGLVVQVLVQKLVAITAVGLFFYQNVLLANHTLPGQTPDVAAAVTAVRH